MSRADPPDTAALETRLVELEVKVAFQDNLLGDLDDALRALRDEIDGLRRDLSSFTDELRQRGVDLQALDLAEDD